MLTTYLFSVCANIEGGDSLKLADFGLAMSMSEKSEEENTDEVSIVCFVVVLSLLFVHCNFNKMLCTSVIPAHCK